MGEDRRGREGREVGGQDRRVESRGRGREDRRVESRVRGREDRRVESRGRGRGWGRECREVGRTGQEGREIAVGVVRFGSGSGR